MSWLNAYYLFHKNPPVMTSMEEKDKINVEMPCAQSCRVKKNSLQQLLFIKKKLKTHKLYISFWN